MYQSPKLHKLEHLKEASQQLRGAIVEELNEEADHVSGDTAQILKHHGTYQQDDRDQRGRPSTPGNPKGRSYMFMVRVRIPGGKVTAEQMLAQLDLCDEYGNGTLRITTRQGLQLHGVLKTDLKSAIRNINTTQLTTFGACGDVERNVTCCPAPYRHNDVRTQMQCMADQFAEHLKPRTTAYSQIWLQDEDGNKHDVTEFQPVDEPVYGARYLPRKFKTGFALPEDNCVDLLTYDLGFVGVVEQNAIVGYNVYVGGGQGTTPAIEDTFPAVAQKMAFVEPEQVISVGEAIVQVHRDYGNRANRKLARLKYLVADWGLKRFKAQVEEFCGRKLAVPHPAEVSGADDHLGWHEQGDGRWFLGINVDNGRIKDDGPMCLKSALRTILQQYGMPLRLTALQGLILCDIPAERRSEINRLLTEHGVRAAEDLTLLRRYAMACPALPTCGLAITDSERVFPQVVDRLESEMQRLGIEKECITVHMTGCPNGCTRPYTPDIGLVGKARGQYTLFLGGNAHGTRLAFPFKDRVPLDQIVANLVPILQYYTRNRKGNETFGDFCYRMGPQELAKVSD